MMKLIASFHYSLSVVLLIGCFTIVQAQVTLNGNQLFVNGEPYAIKGICWSPSGIGDSTGNRFSQWYQTDLQVIADMNANTIRTYVPIYNVDVLNAIQSYGLRVIIGFTVEDTAQDLSYISQFKNHEAILMWCFGNEFNYHPEWFGGNIENWYSLLEGLAQRAQQLDPNHPVTTAHGELPDSLARNMCPTIQLWGINAYRWDNLTFLFEDWTSWSSKPIWISESGADSYHTVCIEAPSGYESESNQDSANQKIWQRVEDNLSALDPQKQCIGITFFEFNDEWWKAGNPDSHDVGLVSPPGMPYDNFFNEEYFGFVRIDRSPKLAYDSLKYIWQEFATNIKDRRRLDLSSPILHQNFPNPFNGFTQILFELNDPGFTVVRVFNLTGENVRTLWEGYLKVGWHRMIFDAQGMPTGIYFYQLIFRQSSVTGKMLYIK